MKSTVVFVAVLLILVVAMVAIVTQTAVQAEKPITKWCVEGTLFVAIQTKSVGP